MLNKRYIKKASIFTTILTFTMVQMLGFAALKTCAASSWQYVGNAGFSAGVADYQSLAVHNNTPYVAYSDWGNGSKATVMKYDVTTDNWVTVGNPGFSAADVYYTSIAIDNYNNPYVAYKDNGNGGKATVKKYDTAANSWITVGSEGFSAGVAGYTSIALDSNNVPYVIYQDGGNGYNPTVMKYDTTTDNWVTVGNPGFSAIGVNWTSIAVHNNIPYVSYQDCGNGNKVTVMKYDTATDQWLPVGSEGFSAGVANFPSIAIDTNTPYVSYQDETNGSKATVMKYDATTNNWITVGNPGFSAGIVEYTSIDIDNNNPYVAYKDNANGGKATVKKYDTATNSWITVGSEGFTTGNNSYFTSIAIDNNTPYVSYLDMGNTNKATVMKYVTTTNAEIPTITTQPSDTTVNIGGTATLSLTASITQGALSYQWYSNTTKSNTGGTIIPGATNSSYSAPTLTTGTNYYYCVIKNTDTTATVNKTATATSNAVTVTVNKANNSPTSITQQPGNIIVKVGGTATLSLTVSVTQGALSYQWYSNTTKSNTGGTIIPGAIYSNYSAPTAYRGTTYYYCVVTNTTTTATGINIDIATSNAAKVQVK